MLSIISLNLFLMHDPTCLPVYFSLSLYLNSLLSVLARFTHFIILLSVLPLFKSDFAFA